MSQRSRYEQLTRLQEQVRAVGRGVDRLFDRFLGGVVAGTILSLGGATVTVAALVGPVSLVGWLAPVGVGVAVASIAATMLFFGGMIFIVTPLCEWKRHCCRRSVRSALVRLTYYERAAVLAPLREERAASEIVGPLLREFALAKEVSPGAAPDGRGDEPSVGADPEMGDG
jgi:hypothetical protein